MDMTQAQHICDAANREPVAHKERALTATVTHEAGMLIINLTPTEPIVVDSWQCSTHCKINVGDTPWSVVMIEHDVARDAPEHQPWGTWMLERAIELLGLSDGILWTSTKLRVNSERFWIAFAERHGIQDIRLLSDPDGRQSELARARHVVATRPD